MDNSLIKKIKKIVKSVQIGYNKNIPYREDERQAL